MPCLTTLAGDTIGSSAAKKVAFFGATPVVQQTGADLGAIVTLTDSTGLSGTHNDTLAAVTTFTPSVTWNGSSVYPSAADATAIATAITVLNQNASDTAQKVIELVAFAAEVRATLLAYGLHTGAA